MGTIKALSVVTVVKSMDPDWVKAGFPDYSGQIAFSTDIPEKKAEHEESEELGEYIQERLEENSIELYSHQAKAIDKFLNGEDVCITTSTGSGKTLAYTLSVAQLLEKDPRANVMMIFPTKALTRDQKKEIGSIFSLLDIDVDIGIYDGDVSSSRKREIRKESDVILTNFAGLNLYLGHHEKWTGFFEDLEAIVIDESHHYTGLLGMHVAWIIRRLRRISRYYFSEPRFILSSATLGNPSQHSRKLTGKDLTVIDEDGSERGKRDLIFWNPPRLDDEIKERKSTHRESSKVLAHLVDKGLQSLMFAPSRKMTELDSLWAKEILKEEYREKDRKVEPYHAGLSKEQRREVENGLKDSDVDAVVSTTALELGINIGSIGSTILSGYPGTRISFWQQIGRAGREDEEVMSVLVPFNSALDQYIVDHPGHILGNPIEDAVIDLSNNTVFSSHLLAASQELPIKKDDEEFLTERIEKACRMWKKEGSLVGDIENGFRYGKSDYPQNKINLYSAGKDTFELQIKKENGEIESLPEMEKNRAYRDFHPGAIYLHQNQYYQVEEFDEGVNPSVTLEPVDTDYYTTTLRDTDITDVRREEEKDLGPFRCCKGRGKVIIDYFAYKKKKISNDDVIETQRTGLEPIELNTQVMWLEIPEDMEREMLDVAEEKLKKGDWDRSKGAKYHYEGALHAAEHSLIQMLPLLMLIDKKDVGGISTAYNSELDSGAIFIYDGIQGGVGFSHDAYERIEELVESSKESLKDCDCGRLKGCPACTYSADCGNDNDPLNRPLAIGLLDF